MAAGDKKIRSETGKVISDKMDKTVTVLVERLVRHPIYGKYVRRSTKLHAHDEDNTCQMGDTVTIQETRPISKSKCWKVINIVEKSAT